MITLKQVNKAIQQVYPLVELVRGESHFYIRSDNDEMEERICRLYQSGIYVYQLNSLTIESWVNEVKFLFNNPDNF